MKKYEKHFIDDVKYLEEAYYSVESLWNSNLEKFKIKKNIKYVLLSEAPLWGKNNKYIYNLDAPTSQFIHVKTLINAAELDIINPQKSSDKKKLLNNLLLELGIIVLDIFPFCLNNTTGIQYRKLGKLYKELVVLDYLNEKMRRISKYSSGPIYFIYRYQSGIKHTLEIVKPVVSGYTNQPSYIDLGTGQRGGGINVNTLRYVLQNH